MEKSEVRVNTKTFSFFKYLYIFSISKSYITSVYYISNAQENTTNAQNIRLWFGNSKSRHMNET